MALINPDLSGIVDGAVGDAADWTTPFNTIIDEINGNLDNANIKTTAGISSGKLAAIYGPTSATEDANDRTTTSAAFEDHPMTGTSVTTTGNSIILVTMVGLFKASDASGGFVRIKTPSGATKLTGGVNYGNSSTYPVISGTVFHSYSITSIFSVASAAAFSFIPEWAAISNTITSRNVSISAVAIGR